MEMNRGLKTFVNSALWTGLLRRVFLPPLFDELRRLTPGRVLEIGCGRGDTTRMLLDLFPQAAITATDYDPAQVGLAAKRAWNQRLTVRRADATLLQFPDASFDLVVELNTFHHIADWRAALRECARTLAPGGVFAVMDEDRRIFNPLFRWIDRPESLFTKDEFLAAADGAGLTLSADVGGRRIFKTVFRK